MAVPSDLLFQCSGSGLLQSDPFMLPPVSSAHVCSFTVFHVVVAQGRAALDRSRVQVPRSGLHEPSQAVTYANKPPPAVTYANKPPAASTLPV